MYIFQFIAACPTGTYWDDVLCILCPIGTYQDEVGQQECTSCPGGYTTLYMASRNQTDCSGKIEFRHYLTIFVTKFKPRISKFCTIYNHLYFCYWVEAVKTSIYMIRVITKLPNSEQSYKGKFKTHKYINRQNQSTTGKLKTVMTLTWYRHF